MTKIYDQANSIVLSRKSTTKTFLYIVSNPLLFVTFMRELSILKKSLLFACSLILAGPVQAWEIRVQATDSFGNTATSGNLQSLPGTPVSTSIQIADVPPDAYAEVNLPAGTLRALASDPAGGGANTMAIASANLNRHYFINNTVNTYTVPGGLFGMGITGTHSVSGTPINSGVQTASVQYNGILEWRSLTNGTIWTQDIVSSKLETSWLDGVVTGTTMTNQTLLGNSFVTTFTDTDYTAFLEIPMFTWDPDEILYLHATLDLFATTTDSGLAAMIDATNTASLSLGLPPGIDVYDAGLMTLNDLSWVTVAPVPVPAAVWLFGSGLIGLIGVARRRART